MKTGKPSTTRTPQHLRRGAAAVCLAAVGLLLPWGCSKRLEPREREQASLAALEKGYGLDGKNYRSDDRGWVVELSLDGEQFDDDALEHVKNFKMLRSLSLWKSSVTDSGVAKLQELKRLEKLILVWTKISDHSLSTLANMPSLRYVWLPKTGRLTHAAIDQFKSSGNDVKVWAVNLPPKQK